MFLQKMPKVENRCFVGQPLTQAQPGKPASMAGSLRLYKSMACTRSIVGSGYGLSELFRDSLIRLYATLLNSCLLLLERSGIEETGSKYQHSLVADPGRSSVNTQFLPRLKRAFGSVIGIPESAFAMENRLRNSDGDSPMILTNTFRQALMSPYPTSRPIFSNG